MSTTGQHINQSQLSRLTGIDLKALNAMRNAGVFGEHWQQKTNRVMYDVVPALTCALEKINRNDGGTKSAAYDKIEAALENLKASQSAPMQPQPDILPEPTTIAEANKQRLIYQAKRERLKYELEKGVLVPKEEVYRELFTKGKELREAFLAIPDRVIDEIRSKKSRAEAHLLLTEAIHDALTRLSTYAH